LLHKNPELSGHETETAKRIAGFLGSYQPTKLIEGIGGTGVAAIYSYFDSGPTVLIRCELDALPIQEVNEFDHRSEIEGISHKCGHDGHMTIVAGLAAHLSKNRPKIGKVILLFQPAEENGEGAKAVLEDPKFEEIRPDHVFALHNLPGYPLHQVVCRPNSFTASVQSIIIKLHGKTAHAGEPDMGINPALAIAEILQQTDAIQVPRDKPNFKQVTPIQIEMGEEAYGISAGFGEVKLTIRTWDNETMKELADECERIAVDVGHKHGLAVAKKLNRPARVHIEFDTGMNRTGFTKKELKSILNLLLSNLEHLVIEGFCTHYAGAESIANHVRVKKQIKTFANYDRWMREKGIMPKRMHTACSAASMTYPQTRMDLARIGIMQYGFWPSRETFINYLSTRKDKHDPMKRVITWKSTIMTKHRVKPGEFVGYGNSYMAENETVVAIVPVGYAHGYSRSLSNQGRVLIHGQRMGVVGLVNMNMLIVDVTNIPECQIGDEVVLIGKQRDLEISVSSFGELSIQLNYELLTRLPQDIPRIVIP
jgi:alanine racemase